VTWDDDRAEYDRMLARLEGLRSVSVEVGVLGDGEGLSDRDPETNVSVAITHEYGDPARRIPQRSFIRAALDRDRDEILDRMTIEAESVIRGRDPEQAAARVGLYAEERIRAFIRQGHVRPPLSPVTIARRPKGTTTPLLDTGQLVASITSAVIRSAP